MLYTHQHINTDPEERIRYNWIYLSGDYTYDDDDDQNENQDTEPRFIEDETVVESITKSETKFETNSVTNIDGDDEFSRDRCTTKPDLNDVVNELVKLKISLRKHPQPARPKGRYNRSTTTPTSVYHSTKLRSIIKRSNRTNRTNRTNQTNRTNKTVKSKPKYRKYI